MVGKVIGLGLVAVFLFIGAMNMVGGQLEQEFQQQAQASYASVDMTVDAERDVSLAAPVSPTFTDEERSAAVGADPEMKAASDYIGSLINSNGHLCHRVIDVEPSGPSEFTVKCVERRNGSGTVRYLVNGSTNTAIPL